MMNISTEVFQGLSEVISLKEKKSPKELDSSWIESFITKANSKEILRGHKCARLPQRKSTTFNGLFYRMTFFSFKRKVYSNNCLIGNRATK